MVDKFYFNSERYNQGPEKKSVGPNSTPRGGVNWFLENKLRLVGK